MLTEGMAAETVYKCDRCREFAVLRVDVEIGKGTPETGPAKRPIDLCAACAGRAILLFLEGMSYRAKNIWASDAIKVDRG